jgi:hypothetical protein
MFMLLIACTVHETRFDETLDAHAVRELTANLDRGDLSFRSAPNSATLDISGRAYGYSPNEDNAQRNLDGTEWAVVREGSRVDLRSTSLYMNSAVDWELAGPGDLIADIEVENGNVTLDGLAGFQTVRADWIDVDLVGGGDLIATGSVDATFHPHRGDTIRIDAESDVTLRLPYGAEIDLQVWGNPEGELIIEDLGFHSVATDPGYFAGLAGYGTIQVDVYAGGDVTIESIW